MHFYLHPFFNHDDHQCGAPHCDHDHCDDCDIDESDPILELEDPETGEIHSFFLADQFDFEDEDYAVLVPDDEEADEYFIARMGFDENDEAYIETLAEDEVDKIYDAYEQILDEFFADDDDEDEDDED
ncbi:MAG: DUF1292 domain-containing protein [Eubacteriales bacterium]|nr:DUF1292 domain-containing protein [Clostridiales bacterium]MDY5835962.1 DUF1292 domain-containing protein [Eubacteriales bacterium]